MSSLVKLGLSTVILAVLVYVCLGMGGDEWIRPEQLPIELWELRWPRIGTALLIGAALSCSGAALQALFGNPLADPSLIGTSSGAALGVVSMLAIGSVGIGIPIAAFIGASVVCLLVLLTHHLFGGGRVGLLVIGFVLSAFCGAIVNLIMFVSDDMVLRSATNWLMGSLANAGFIPIHYALIGAIIGLILLISLGRQLDCLMLGEETATSMGVNVNRTKILTIMGAAILTGAAVSLSGIIGFVGMMIPNVVSRVYGGSRQKIMIISSIIGAVFLLLVDTVARSVVYPVDVPVGIVIAIFGAPFFLWLFLKASRG